MFADGPRWVYYTMKSREFGMLFAKLQYTATGP